jgi:hypothetical protein
MTTQHLSAEITHEGEVYDVEYIVYKGWRSNDRDVPDDPDEVEVTSVTCEDEDVEIPDVCWEELVCDQCEWEW